MCSNFVCANLAPQESPAASGRLVNKVRGLDEESERSKDSCDKRVTGELSSLANEPCVPVGRADWGREGGKAILAVNLLQQLDNPTGGKTKVGEQKSVSKSHVVIEFSTHRASARWLTGANARRLIVEKRAS